ncbi:MAG: ABC transporter ATP-binding protein, partial [Treponema sp.]|nr:ABC transporter ATP-binding protein [Treponema sp.]
AVKAPEKKRRLSYKEQREFEELEKNIAKWEEDKKTLEAAMADTDYAKVQKAGEEYARLEKELETAYSRWEELAEFI